MNLDLLGLQRCTNCSLCGQHYGEAGQPPEWRRPKQKVPGQWSLARNPIGPIDVMLIGEAPGEHEDKSGIPFVGDAGSTLFDALESSGLSQLNLYITNVNKCRPPGNRAPLQAEVAACNDWLQIELQEVQPKVIVCLGKTAISAFMPQFKFKGKVGDKIGKPFALYVMDTIVHDGEYGNVYGCYHPAARDAKQRATIPLVFEQVAALFGITPAQREVVDYQLEIL